MFWEPRVRATWSSKYHVIGPLHQLRCEVRPPQTRKHDARRHADGTFLDLDAPS